MSVTEQPSPVLASLTLAARVRRVVSIGWSMVRFAAIRVRDATRCSSICRESTRSVTSVMKPSRASSSPLEEKTPRPCSQTHFISPEAALMR
jgi:hypothetical protein